MLFCKPGYSLVGSQTTFCNGTVWNRSIGTCRKTQTVHAMKCDFELYTICDWVPEHTQDFKWIWQHSRNVKNKQLQSGPFHDHTFDKPLKGHFMLATFANPLQSSKALLISPVYPAHISRSACFQFYYHMYGATDGVLRVYVKPDSITITEMFDLEK